METSGWRLKATTLDSHGSVHTKRQYTTRNLHHSKMLRTRPKTKQAANAAKIPTDEVEEAVAALKLAILYPTDYLAVVRSTYDKELLRTASRLLPDALRTELKELVMVANKEVEQCQG